MIPSDHFVRYYNEVFRALYESGREHLEAYWAEIARQQTQKLGETFRKGGLRACYDYWQKIRKEENCEMEIVLTEDYLKMHMKKCPSLSKVMDNDAGPFEFYCDHCPGWVEPVLRHAGLFPVKDIMSRTVPECRSRIYSDREKAEEYSRALAAPRMKGGD